MLSTRFNHTLCAARYGAVSLLAAVSILAADSPTFAAVFDVGRTLECREVVTEETVKGYPERRVVEVMLRVSVRFAEGEAEAVDEITVDFDASGAGLVVHRFLPATQLASDVTGSITRQTRTDVNRAVDTTLGGGVPVPLGEVVAHLTPSIDAGLAKHESTTETVTRLPPKRPLVVSGTSHRGQGVFFKLKRSSQTTLEGVHEFCVELVVPPNWTGSQARVTCTAAGRRKVLWVEQPKVFGRWGALVSLYPHGDEEARLTADAALPTGERRECCKPLIDASDFEAGKEQLEKAVSVLSKAADF